MDFGCSLLYQSVVNCLMSRLRRGQGEKGEQSLLGSRLKIMEPDWRLGKPERDNSDQFPNHLHLIAVWCGDSYILKTRQTTTLVSGIPCVFFVENLVVPEEHHPLLEWVNHGTYDRAQFITRFVSLSGMVVELKPREDLLPGHPIGLHMQWDAWMRDLEDPETPSVTFRPFDVLCVMSFMGPETLIPIAALNL